MQLFKKEVINKKRQEQNQELTRKNEKLVASLKKILSLQKDIDFDAEKAKKVRDYLVWCEDLQKKQSKELASLKAYEKLVDDKKEEYYRLIETKDVLEEKIVNLKEELSRLLLQVEWNKNLLKQNVIVHS